METVFILWIFFFNDGIESESSSQTTVGPFATVAQCLDASKLIHKGMGNGIDGVDKTNFRMACISVMKDGSKPAPVVTKRNEIDRIKVCKDFSEDIADKLNDYRSVSTHQKEEYKNIVSNECWALLSKSIN